MRIAVLGTGLMGRSIARALMGEGHEVRVWNRTTQTARPLGDEGAFVSESVADAIDAVDVVLCCLLDYSVTEAVLTPAAERVHGRVLVNLATGTPAEAGRFAELAASWGADYLDGAIEAYPDGIGRAESLINVSGSAAAWDRAADVLRALGGASTFVDTSPSAANVLDAAMAGAFHNIALGGFLEALAFTSRSGIAPAALRENLDYWISILAAVAREALDVVEAGTYETDQATLDVYLAAVRTWRDSMIRSGTRSSLMTANLHNLEIAQARGHGAESIYAQFAEL